MIVLDTDVLSIIQRGQGEEYTRLAARLDQAGATHPVCVTVISFEEQMRGWLTYIGRSRAVARQVDAYARFLSLLQDFAARPVLPFDEQAAQRFQQLTQARVRIGTMDLKIASIVLSRGATLISRNLRDYRQVPGLQVEDRIDG